MKNAKFKWVWFVNSIVLHQEILNLDTKNNGLEKANSFWNMVMFNIHLKFQRCTQIVSGTFPSQRSSSFRNCLEMLEGKQPIVGCKITQSTLHNTGHGFCQVYPISHWTSIFVSLFLGWFFTNSIPWDENHHQTTTICAIGYQLPWHFHIIGDGRLNPIVGVYVPIYKDSLLKVGWPSPIQRVDRPWLI